MDKKNLRELSKWSIGGFVIGAISLLIAILQYRILYPDFDKFLSFGAIGILFIAISWLYQRDKSKTKKLDSLQESQAEVEDFLKEVGVIKESLIEPKEINEEIINANGDS